MRPIPGRDDAVIYEKRGAVGWVTLNRPDQLNAYNVAMRDALYGVLGAIHDDPDVRAMVLTGAGPSFSTGGDLHEFGTLPLRSWPDGCAFAATSGGGSSRCPSQRSPPSMVTQSAAVLR